MSKRKETPDLMGNEEEDALADLLGQKARRREEREPGERKPDEPKRKTSKERLQKRATYDISAELKEAIAEHATRLGIPASQLAHFLLLHAWQHLQAGEIDPEPFLEPSTSPAFRNNLDIDAVVAEMEK
jgi:hypothetical protein